MESVNNGTDEAIYKGRNRDTDLEEGLADIGR